MPHVYRETRIYGRWMASAFLLCLTLTIAPPLRATAVPSTQADVRVLRDRRRRLRGHGRL